ncbi:MAG: tRNA pseudouridine(38-40) synthase TruA [Myxococcales bacterium]|nr:tRNA pseudouridine(38-40) synthase TruA [Myxococcales bacterium]
MTSTKTSERTPSSFEHGVRLILSYDGTDFVGWQHQPEQRTVQGELDRALDAMQVKRSRLRGCSRTDAGVHALGQVVGFGCERELPERAWTVGLNGHLPDDISVRAYAPAAPDYDPRFDAHRKLYRYLVSIGDTRDPLLRRTTWYVGPRLARRDRRPRRPIVEDFLDLDAMRDAATRLHGTHDFQAFRALSDERENTVRTIHRLDVIPGFGGRDDVLAIEVEGNAFLRNMVRILAGTLMEVGRGKVEPNQLPTILGSKDRRANPGPTLPPQGLSLEWIRYT